MADLKELAKQTIENGVTPLTLHYELVSSFTDNKKIVRTSMWINSLDLGVVSPNEYRFVARRSKQGDELVKRHIRKLFKILPEFLKNNPDVSCVTVPTFGRLLDQRVLFDMLTDAFAQNPQVDKSRVCIELSADILFEDLDESARELKKLQDYGLKIAVCEVGDEFCPALRLSKIPFHFAFLDEYAVQSLATEKEEEIAGGLVSYLHAIGKQVFACGLTDESQKARAKALSCEGYSFQSNGAIFPYSNKGDEE